VDLLLPVGTEVIVVVYEKSRSHGCGEKRGQQYGRRLAEARKKPSEDQTRALCRELGTLHLISREKPRKRSQKADEDEEVGKEPKARKMMKMKNKRQE
jgi:hypothetical protein